MKRHLMMATLAGFVLVSPLLRAQYATPRGEVVFPDKTQVHVEIAETPDERAKGLMFRKSLGETDGMLFIFEERGRHAFWMKNTLISLDLFWLDRSGKVVSIAEAIPPCKTPECPTYPPTAEADYVLEVNAGFAKKHKVKVGDTLVLKGLKKTVSQ